MALVANHQGLIVTLFFMHVKYVSEKLTKVVIIAAVFWLMILLALSMVDYGTRYFS